MRRYSYIAKDDTSGQTVRSVVQAESEQAAARTLLAQNLTPIRIREQAAGNWLQRLRQRITTKDKVAVTRQLATLLEAGLPLAQSLRTIADQLANPRMRAVVEDVLTAVEAGRSLEESFARHPAVFDRVFIAMVRAGEASGTLADALARVADQQETATETMRRVRGALDYPAIVLVVIIAVITFMMLTVVPQVARLYAGLNQPLPWLTQVLVACAAFTSQYWWGVLALVVVAVAAGRSYIVSPAGQRTKDLLLLQLPLVRQLALRLYMARFTRTGQTLLASGVPVLDALQICAAAVGNSYVGASITTAAGQVKGGAQLSQALSMQPYILPLVPQMVAIGEKSGQIDGMLGRLARVYEGEVDEQVKALSTTLEPVLMVLMAAMAGGIIMAIFFPLYSLVSTTSGQL